MLIGFSSIFSNSKLLIMVKLDDVERGSIKSTIIFKIQLIEDKSMQRCHGDLVLGVSSITNGLVIMTKLIASHRSKKGLKIEKAIQ